MEREAASKHLFEELETKSKQVQFLENQVKELKQKLQVADATKSKEKVSQDPFFNALSGVFTLYTLVIKIH